VLIGDAAHAVSPNIGAGATNAMHDAALLAPCALDLKLLPSTLRPLPKLQSSKSFKEMVLGSPTKSGAETDAWGFDRFESLAEEWTLLRLEDARALTDISRKVNDGMLYSIHKDLGLFLRALPIYLPWGLAQTSFPGKSALFVERLNSSCVCMHDVNVKLPWGVLQR
jgi:hypothetical protein